MSAVVLYYWVIWPKEAFSFQMCLNALITSPHSKHSIPSSFPFKNDGDLGQGDGLEGRSASPPQSLAPTWWKETTDSLLFTDLHHVHCGMCAHR